MKKHHKDKEMRNKVRHRDIKIPTNSRTVNISQLKAFVENNFPLRSPLRVVFVDEDDLLSAEAFLGKAAGMA